MGAAHPQGMTLPQQAEPCPPPPKTPRARPLGPAGILCYTAGEGAQRGPRSRAARQLASEQETPWALQAGGPRVTTTRVLPGAESQRAARPAGLGHTRLVGRQRTRQGEGGLHAPARPGSRLPSGVSRKEQSPARALGSAQGGPLWTSKLQNYQIASGRCFRPLRCGTLLQQQRELTRLVLVSLGCSHDVSQAGRCKQRTSLLRF